jgi:geranylgeranyl reductase family protein
MGQLVDVIIVGAGPSGASAAYDLGEAGLRVVVLEKQSLPRYKTCGGGVSAGLLAEFPFSFEPVIESRVNRISYAFKGQMVTIPLPDRQMQMVMRADFDAHILAHARVETHQDTTVTRVTEREERVVVETARGRVLESRYLIAADGANSVVAHSLGLRRRRSLAAAIEIEAPVPPEVMQRFADAPLFIFGEIYLGYLWIFPKKQHLSVGIGAFHPRPGKLQSTLERVMKRYGVSVAGLPVHGHPLPIYTRREKISTRRVLMVGDAAGLVEPFSGEGIRFAVRSGRLAAQAIASSQVERYPQWIRQKIGVNHTYAAGLALLFHHLPWTCFQLGVRNPFATHAFIDLFSNRASYPEVILRIFGSLPFFLATELAAGVAGLFGGAKQGSKVRSAVYYNDATLSTHP